MTHGHYHPVTQAKMTGGFDANGTLIALHMRISGQSILASVLPERLQSGRDPATFQGLNPGGAESAIGYTVPNLLIDHSMRNPSVPPGFWRGVNINQNAIYLECFINELAQSIGRDPPGVPAEADDTASQTSRRAQRGCGEDWLGKIPATRDSPRDCADDVFRQLRGGRC